MKETIDRQNIYINCSSFDLLLLLCGIEIKTSSIQQVMHVHYLDDANG